MSSNGPRDQETTEPEAPEDPATPAEIADLDDYIEEGLDGSDVETR